MKNLNEHIERMKSLMSEERLYGNLVDKKPINEWGKLSKALSLGDDVLKIGVKNSDEAVDVINRAVKYFDDANIAVRYSDEMLKEVDDIAKDFVKPINSSKELISHYKKYEPIYKYLYKDTPKKIKNYESYLKALESGTVTDLTMMVKGKPLFSYMPEGVNMVALKNYLNELPEEVAKKRIKTIQSSYRDYFKGKYMEVIDDTGEIGSSVGKGDDAVGGTTKGSDDAIGGTTKGSDDAIGGTTKGGKDIPSGPFRINSVKELEDLINKLIKSNVTNDVRIIFSDGTEFVFRIDGRTTEQIIKDMPIPKGMSPKGKEDLTKRMTEWVNKNTLKKIPSYVWKFVSGQDILTKPWKYRSGAIGEEHKLINRGMKFLSRAIPTSYLYYSYEEGKFLSGGEYVGIVKRKLGLASEDIKNLALKQICDAGYQATYNEKTDTAGFNCERFYSEFYKQAENVVNSKKLDCETLLKNDYEENKKYLFSSLDKKYLKSELKSQNEEDYDGSAGDKWSVVKDTWDEWFNKYLGQMPGSEDWDVICQDLLDKKILACQVEKEKNSAQKDGYKWDEVSGDGESTGGGTTTGGGSQEGSWENF